jgi:NTP pyrophosphatase (non-canonical NTP hydrolase)
MNNTIPQWQQLVYALAKSKGWYDNVDLNAHREMASYAIQQSAQLASDTESIRQGNGYGASCEPVYVDSLTSEQHVKIARLWLVASEVFEAIECVVNGQTDPNAYSTHKNSGKPEGLGIELADVAIRLLDFCEAYQIPLDTFMRVKHTYNESRPQRHGGKKV